MEKDIKKESEKLLAKIKADTPKLLNHLIKRATYLYWDTSAYDYLVDSITRYVAIDKEACLSDKTMYDNFVFNSFEIAQDQKSSNEDIITEFEYIQMMYEVEKKDSQSFRKWGYEFSINEDGSVSIRREMGRITIQVDVANKITLV
jgi:hypothetical protein